jgi:hypothetical protein
MMRLPILPLRGPPTINNLDLPRHSAELAFVLTARTKRALLATELSVAILGGWLQILSQIQEEDVKKHLC